MNSKEALFEIYKQAKSHRRTTKQIIENKQQYEQIWKDLEVLEIIKEYIKIGDCKFEKDNKVKKCIIMFIPEMVEDYRVIKEWLENDN